MKKINEAVSPKRQVFAKYNAIKRMVPKFTAILRKKVAEYVEDEFEPDEDYTTDNQYDRACARWCRKMANDVFVTTDNDLSTVADYCGCNEEKIALDICISSATDDSTVMDAIKGVADEAMEEAGLSSDEDVGDSYSRDYVWFYSEDELNILGIHPEGDDSEDDEYEDEVEDEVEVQDSEYKVDDKGAAVFPAGIGEIPEKAFEDNKYLKTVVIPNGVTSIGKEAFSYCTGLTSVTIPNSVTSIASSAFSKCFRLTSVTIGSGVTLIGTGAFWDCEGLKSITIPDSVTDIWQSAFCGCEGLTTVKIPDGVSSIEYGTFEGCSGLTSIVIPNSVKNIGKNAFHGCFRLKSVEIPANCNVDLYAFENSVRIIRRGTIRETSKITLTFGQLKRLVKEGPDSPFAKDKKALRAQKDILWKQAWDYMVKAIELQSGNPVGLHDEDGLSDRLLVDVCDYGDDPGHIDEIADSYEKRVSDIVLAVDVWYEPDRKSRKDMQVDIAGICRNFVKRYRFRKMFASLDVDVYQMNKFGCSIFFYKK